MALIFKHIFVFILFILFTFLGCYLPPKKINGNKPSNLPYVKQQISLREKAQLYDILASKYHIPGPQNLIVTLRFEENSVKRDDFYDAPLWTGMYLASQSYRYSVTRDEEALENIRRAISGIESLLKITGIRGMMARYYFPTGTERRDDLFPGKNEFSKFEYINDISRDQYIGVMFGLNVAYDLVPETEKERIKKIISDIIFLFTEDDWRIKNISRSLWKPSNTLNPKDFFGMNSASHLLSFSQTSARVEKNSEFYQKNVKRYSRYLKDIFLMPNRYVDYFAFHLHYLSFFNLIRLETDKTLKEQYLKIFLNKLWSQTKTHENALFNYIYSVLIDEKNANLLENTKEILNQFPAPPRRNFLIRNSDNIDIQKKISWMGLLLFKDEFIFSKTPIPVGLRPPSDFLWQRTPFALDGGGDGQTEYPGIDFLIVYWMGRHYGFIDSTI